MYFLLEVCENPDILRIIFFILKILDYVFVFIPIGLIVFLTIDLVKMVISSENNQSKNLKMVLNRIIFAACIFFVPTIVEFFTNILNDTNSKFNARSYATCITNANKDAIAEFQKMKDEEDALQEEERKKNINKNNQVNNNSSSNNNYNSSSNNSIDIQEQGGPLYERLVNKMISIANNEVGYKEGPADDTKYGRELNVNNNPWCATFVTWVVKNTTALDDQGRTVNLYNDIIQKEGKIMYPYSAVNSIYTFNTNSNLNFYYSNYHGGTYTPKKGDYIYFDWNGDWNKSISPNMFYEGDHVGIVENVVNGTVYTIEGNTGQGTVAKVNYKLTSKSIMGYGSWYK